MKFISILLFFIIANIAEAQVTDRLNGSFENRPIEELIGYIEKQTTYKFYYDHTWVDTATVALSFTDSTVPEILQQAFVNTGFQFFIDHRKIILTHNVLIEQQLDPAFFEEAQSSSTGVSDDHSFTREYLPSQVSRSDQEKNYIEVGTKKSTPANGASTLSGYIKDKKSDEPVFGALVSIPELNKAVSTNAFGFYSIGIRAGRYKMKVQYVGMKTIETTLILHSDGKHNFLMEDDVISLKEVTIESDRDANINSIQMGLSTIDVKSMKNMPKILGENDVLKVALMMPGIKTIGEGAAGLNVRGGNADQNLMLLNEATIYNTSHFLGFFSVFNSDAISSSEIYKSAIPAQYGGRLSSIFDMQLKNGNQKKFSGQGGIGPVTARLTLEVPLIKDRTSIMAGGRTTYSDWLLKRIPDSNLKNSGASFYDLFGRITHDINDKNSIYLSGYYSRDNFKLSSDSLFSYDNILGSLQWRHIFSDNLHSVVSLTHSEYRFNVFYGKTAENAFNTGFGINESNFKWDLNYYHGKQKIDFGVQSKVYDLNPGYKRSASNVSLVESKQLQLERGAESALYLADNIDINPDLSVSIGLRYSLFSAIGPRTLYNYRSDLPKDNLTITDTTQYADGKWIKTFHGPEYRISGRYTLTPESSVKVSYNRTRQYVHMLSNTVSVSPTYTWKLSDPGIKPQVADQVSAGYYRNIRNNTLELSIEVYHKWMKNVVDYKTGAELMLNENIEKDILQGQGKAYGAELLVRKKNGKLNGWVSYTYSRALLRLSSEFDQENVNGGHFFPANYDKPHDFSVVSNYKITRRYSASLNFTYNTGRPITYPVGQYKFAGEYRINYSERNAFRIPDYVRLDLGFNIEGNHKIKKAAHGFWSFSIYNVLARKNPYSIYFVAGENGIKAYKLSIFAVPIPTIIYNFKF